MLILAADTATTYNAVALCRDRQLLAEVIVLAGRSHSERLLETTDWLLREAHLGLKEVELLAISVGPGSFTGLRVGVATWKGLAFGLKKPLIGVPTLEALARGAMVRNGTICPMLDARMNEVYWALFNWRGEDLVRIGPDRVGRVNDALAGLNGEVTFFGDGAEMHRNEILRECPGARFPDSFESVPRAACVALEALRGFREGRPSDPASVVPVYLRRSQAEESRRPLAAEGAPL